MTARSQHSKIAGTRAPIPLLKSSRKGRAGGLFQNRFSNRPQEAGTRRRARPSGGTPERLQKAELKQKAANLCKAQPEPECAARQADAAPTGARRRGSERARAPQLAGRWHRNGSTAADNKHGQPAGPKKQAASLHTRSGTCSARRWTGEFAATRKGRLHGAQRKRAATGTKQRISPSQDVGVSASPSQGSPLSLPRCHSAAPGGGSIAACRGLDNRDRREQKQDQ